MVWEVINSKRELFVIVLQDLMCTRWCWFQMVWIETPTNPTMKLVDIEAVCKLIHSKTEAYVVVDNTFMSSYFQVQYHLMGLVVKTSASRVADPVLIPTFAVGVFPGQIIPVT